MRLVILSKEEGILDLGVIKVLFICSHPVAMVQRQDGEHECWTAYYQSDYPKETESRIQEWLSDYALCDEPFLVLGEDSFSLLLGGFIFGQLSNDFEVWDRFGTPEKLDS